ncbi:MAG: thioredoxin domain-containing protein [Bacteroidales bacterium]
MKKQPEKPNQLLGQSSPYLLQHLYNPVNWHPWGEEALGKARREDKPLLVSIGYSACHWCHVMEQESFEDQEVALLMNEHFVCVKVDREERPDIDHLYMNAVQLLTGQGGWPLNCFALPDGRPFWGGTYFPRDYWVSVIRQIAEIYSHQRVKAEEQANSLTQGVAQSTYVAPEKDKVLFSQSDAHEMVANLLKGMDPEQGGSKGAPKFPLPGNLEFLLHYHHHTRHQQSLDQVMLTLRRMAMGGIYDQVGGGFSRYATDEHWKVPHFEKMLYDNAQLISLYSMAYKVQGEEWLKEVVYESIDFVKRELTSSEGAFYAALDADSEGQEGKYYVWTEKELDDVLGDQAFLIKKYYHAGELGLWEHDNNILLRTQTREEFAELQGIAPDDWKERLAAARKKLLEARGHRVRPGLDNKVLVGWNGLMIRALADAFGAIGDPVFVQKAQQAADFIINHAMESSGKLFRTIIRKDQPVIDAFLDDYAFFIRSLISLFEVTMKPDYLQKARQLTEQVVEHFGSVDSSLFSFSSREGESLAAPFYEFHDNVMPSSNSMMAINLFFLGQYFENHTWIERASTMLHDMKKNMIRYSSSHCNWGNLLLHQTYPFYTLAISGPATPEVLPEILGRYMPSVLLAPANGPREQIPILQGRFSKEETLFFLCHQGACQLPVKSFGEVIKTMK